MLWLVVTLSTAGRLAVWKTTSLPVESRPAVQSWPGEARVITDAMCAALARRHKCTGYFRADIMPIMRADACRYFGLFEFGGTYADLDVTLRQEYDEKSCAGLCLGHEYSDRAVMSNYFMVSRAGNQCMGNMISACCAALLETDMDFQRDPHLIHNTCGPFALTRVTVPCASHIMTHSELMSHVSHAIASNSWKDNYPSWIEERMRRAGWSYVYEH